MARRLVRVSLGGAPQLDIFSAARGGPERRDRLAPAHVSQVARTVRRAPEVMVKVTGGGKKMGAVRAHLSYISRNGMQPVEMDDGRSVKGKEALNGLLDDWHLDLSTGRYRRPGSGDSPPRELKLVHHVVLSMPAPTPADKVLEAAKKFAREKFGAEHRYAMVLDTDQRHPHVHLVVKAEGFDGRRLHIDKAMLREWRQDFAQYMREQGVAANATQRAVRGKNVLKGLDEVARAKRQQTGSTFIRTRITAVAQELMKNGGVIRDPARAKLLETRKAVVAGWLAVAEQLDRQGETVLAAQVRTFVREMPPVMTDKERIAHELLEALRERRAVAKTRDRKRDQERTR